MGRQIYLDDISHFFENVGCEQNLRTKWVEEAIKNGGKVLEDCLEPSKRHREVDTMEINGVRSGTRTI